MLTVYKKQTFRMKMLLTDASDQPVPLPEATTAEMRVSFGGVVPQTYAVTVDRDEASLTLTVDRDVTATWRRGEYDVQFWVDYGEGQPVETEMVLSDILEVKEGL